jgi:hypothetical protein
MTLDELKAMTTDELTTYRDGLRKKVCDHSIGYYETSRIIAYIKKVDKILEKR